MPIWKRILLSLYYHGTIPARWWNLHYAAIQGRVPVVVVFYHRVANEHPNDWTVSNRTFTRQINWLRAHFEMISLEEAQRRIRSGGNRRPCVSITFDDGYADNCREAIPLLVKHRIPCTYFVTLGNVLEGRPFGHDAARGVPLAPNTLEEIRTMAAAGIEIGAHTYTHPNLARITDTAQLRYEVVSAGNDLAEAISRPIRYFAFPFGQQTNLSQQAFEMADRAGYEAVCSAYGGYNFPGGDGFHLQRIPVDEQMIRLKNWITVDPRKFNTPPFIYRRGCSTEEIPQLSTVE
jgi:peptidoglycan/xylan/chitin deacetylase (PgdA/CDA1 family)